MPPSYLEEDDEVEDPDSQGDGLQLEQGLGHGMGAIIPRQQQQPQRKRTRTDPLWNRPGSNGGGGGGGRSLKAQVRDVGAAAGGPTRATRAASKSCPTCTKKVDRVYHCPPAENSVCAACCASLGWDHTNGAAGAEPPSGAAPAAGDGFFSALAKAQAPPRGRPRAPSSPQQVNLLDESDGDGVVAAGAAQHGSGGARAGKRARGGGGGGGGARGGGGRAGDPLHVRLAGLTAVFPPETPNDAEAVEARRLAPHITPSFCGLTRVVCLPGGRLGFVPPGAHRVSERHGHRLLPQKAEVRAAPAPAVAVPLLQHVLLQKAVAAAGAVEQRGAAQAARRCEEGESEAQRGGRGVRGGDAGDGGGERSGQGGEGDGGGDGAKGGARGGL